MKAILFFLFLAFAHSLHAQTDSIQQIKAKIGYPILGFGRSSFVRYGIQADIDYKYATKRYIGFYFNGLSTRSESLSQAGDLYYNRYKYDMWFLSVGLDHKWKISEGKRLNLFFDIGIGYTSIQNHQLGQFSSFSDLPPNPYNYVSYDLQPSKGSVNVKTSFPITYRLSRISVFLEPILWYNSASIKNYDLVDNNYGMFYFGATSPKFLFSLQTGLLFNLYKYRKNPDSY
jgi:hypothetical protein